VSSLKLLIIFHCLHEEHAPEKKQKERIEASICYFYTQKMPYEYVPNSHIPPVIPCRKCMCLKKRQCLVLFTLSKCFLCSCSTTTRFSLFLKEIFLDRDRDRDRDHDRDRNRDRDYFRSQSARQKRENRRVKKMEGRLKASGLTLDEFRTKTAFETNINQDATLSIKNSLPVPAKNIAVGTKNEYADEDHKMHEAEHSSL
jgi:hypothetical protein